MTDEKQGPTSKAEKGEQKVREDDPHGTRIGAGEGQGSTQGAPTSDRQKTETAGGRTAKE